MKNLLFYICVAATTCVSAFASTTTYPLPQSVAVSNDNLVTVNILNLTNDEINTLVEGVTPHVAVEFSKDTILPLELFLKGNVIQIANGDTISGMQVKIEQTFYIRCVKDDVLFSSDLIEWKPFFDFITGTCSLTLDVQDEHFPTISIGAELDSRQ